MMLAEEVMRGMKTLLKFGVVAVVLGLLGAPNTTSATTLYTFVGDCSVAGSSCYGSTYALFIDDANDAINTTYGATLVINTTSYNGPGSYIDAVDIKVVNSLISNTLALVTAPGGTQNWTSVFNSGQAANNCGAGGGFFICANANSLTSAPVSAGLLMWGWAFSSADQIAFGHIGASYNNATGTLEGNNTSISSAIVTEPNTLILFGAGMIVLAVWGRRMTP